MDFLASVPWASSIRWIQALLFGTDAVYFYWIVGFVAYVIWLNYYDQFEEEDESTANDGNSRSPPNRNGRNVPARYQAAMAMHLSLRLAQQDEWPREESRNVPQPNSAQEPPEPEPRRMVRTDNWKQFVYRPIARALSSFNDDDNETVGELENQLRPIATNWEHDLKARGEEEIDLLQGEQRKCRDAYLTRTPPRRTQTITIDAIEQMHSPKIPMGFRRYGIVIPDASQDELIIRDNIPLSISCEEQMERGDSTSSRMSPRSDAFRKLRKRQSFDESGHSVVDASKLERSASFSLQRQGSFSLLRQSSTVTEEGGRAVADFSKLKPSGSFSLQRQGSFSLVRQSSTCTEEGAHVPVDISQLKRSGSFSLQRQESFSLLRQASTVTVGQSECAICLQEYEAGDVLVRLPCSSMHDFHVECVTLWVNRVGSERCPLCNYDLLEEVETGEEAETEEETPDALQAV